MKLLLSKIIVKKKIGAVPFFVKTSDYKWLRESKSLSLNIFNILFAFSSRFPPKNSTPLLAMGSGQYGSVTFNVPDLTKQMVPTLGRVTGKGKLSVGPPTTAGDTSGFYQEKIPGLYFFVGITPEGGKGTPLSPFLCG